MALSAQIGYVVPSKSMLQFKKREKVQQITCWEYAKRNPNNIKNSSNLVLQGNEGQRTLSECLQHCVLKQLNLFSHFEAKICKLFTAQHCA